MKEALKKSLEVFQQLLLEKRSQFIEETVTRTPVGISGAYNIHTKIKFLQDVSFRYSQKNYIE